ncbi:phage portal protein [Microbacterium jejuense]|uniref:phage portal protein n=1 Tax=Microbacterium jejuense TaxID=1263637 RepID=UPI0031E6F7C2
MDDITASPEAREARGLVERIYARLNARRPEIDEDERYYGGQHNLTFATEEWLKANGARYSGFSDNWCAVVANAEAERLTPIGIQYRGDDAASRNSVSLKTWDDWLLNEMDSQASAGILASLYARRSYVSVWGTDEAEPTYSWDHASNIEIEYDFANPRLRRAALKTWVDGEMERGILYTPDSVWKWQRRYLKNTSDRDSWSSQARSKASTEGGWEPWQEFGDDTWPLDNPLGVVPVVEVPNRPMLRGEPVSELTIVKPKQNAINLMWAYLFLAADFASMPARVLLGAAPPQRQILDKLGKVIGQVPVTMKDLNERRFAVFSSKDARIAQWDAAKLDVFTDAVSVMVGHIAAQTRTPPTYLVTKTGMSNVNAEGLKASEIGLVKKSIEFQTFATPALKEVLRLGHLVRGNTELAEQTRFASLRWANPEIRSEAQLTDSLTKKRNVGYPFRYLMELDGVSPTDMDRIMQMVEEENAAIFSGAAQAALQGELEADVEPTDGPGTEPADAA